MGKAAIIVIPIILVSSFLILLWGISRITKSHNGPSRKDEQIIELNDEAAWLFSKLLLPASLDVDDMDILSERSKDAIAKWFEKRRKVRG